MNLSEAMSMLNDRQREAVEHLEGPLLVVAGPGTGKTQLLSLRAANILATRDVQPQNVLCLTYTDAGVEAMRHRLVGLVGRDAYGIEVSTFHSFALGVRARHPEYFHTGIDARPVSDLYAREIVDSYLKRLPYGSPLSSVYQGVSSDLNEVSSFIGRVKRAGLTPDDCRAIMRQNVACADYLDGCDELMAMLNTRIGVGFRNKADYVAQFEDLVHRAHALAPAELRRPVITTAGIYVPYLTWLDELVARTELCEGQNTKGYRDIRDAQFESHDRIRRASVRTTSERALVACDAYEHYQRTLEERGLIDYDDMVMDCIEAVASNPGLRCALQDRHRYIQVDEFQDTNGSQMRMVDLLCEGVVRPNVMAVGDDDQAIMRFQGASLAYIEQFRAGGGVGHGRGDRGAHGPRQRRLAPHLRFGLRHLGLRNKQAEGRGARLRPERRCAEPCAARRLRAVARGGGPPHARRRVRGSRSNPVRAEGLYQLLGCLALAGFVGMRAAGFSSRIRPRKSV